MEDFNSKYTGQQVEDLLDQVASGNAGGGGGGITVETDPIFSGSPAASITDEKIAEWDNKYAKPSGGIPQSDLAEEVKGALRKAEQYTGTVTEIKVNGNNIGASGGVVDLGNLGTYSKPSIGIPKSDLDTSVQASLGKADTAVQPADIKDEVYIADFTMDSLRTGMNSGTDVDCNIRALVTAMNANKVILVREDENLEGVHVLNGFAEDLLYFSIVDSSGNILWCDGTNYIESQGIAARTLHLQDWWKKQDTLVSGENIKTINGESILGSGDITIGGGSGGGEDIRYFTEFTVEDVIEASKFNGTVVGSCSKLKIAAVNNKLICIPHKNTDTGYLVASYSYNDYGEYSHINLRLEYNGSVYTTSEGDDDMIIVEYPISLAGSTVELQTDNGYCQINVQDNTFYSLFVEGEFKALDIGVFEILHKGATIRFFSSHHTKYSADVLPMTLNIYGPEFLWPNGVVPEIEIDTWYELSLTTSGDWSYCLAVLTPFKPVE